MAPRRILFIEKAFQIKFILKVMGVIVLGMLITGTFLYVFGNYQINRMYTSAHYDLKESWEVYRTAVLLATFVSMTLVACLAVWFTIYDSHKIGGPLYRFRQNLDEIGNGNLTLHTKLRDGDELMPFVDSMNNMTESLRTKVLAVRDSHRKMEEEIDALRKAGANVDDILKTSREMSENIGRLRIDK